MKTGFIPIDPTHCIKQENKHTCGAASFATVAHILGRSDLGYGVSCERLNPHPDHGTEQDDILKLAQTHWKGVTGGADTYAGGLAILSITHFETNPKGSGHYVVALGVEEKETFAGPLILPPEENTLKGANKHNYQLLIDQYKSNFSKEYVLQYYCPWGGQIFIKPFSKMVWVNGGRDYTHWSVNFPTAGDV